MNPRERMLGAIRGERVDRVPLDVGAFQCRSSEYVALIEDPVRRQIAERVFEKMHYFIRVPAHGNRYLMTPPQRMRAEKAPLANGSSRTVTTLDTPKGVLTGVVDHDPVSNTPWTVKYPVETEEDIDKIASVPWERPEGLAPPDLSDLPSSFPERGILSTHISSPFVCVAGMMTYQQFLGMCATHLDLLVELTEVCRQRILDVLRVLLSREGLD